MWTALQRDGPNRLDLRRKLGQGPRAWQGQCRQACCAQERRCDPPLTWGQMAAVVALAVHEESCGPFFVSDVVRRRRYKLMRALLLEPDTDLQARPQGVNKHLPDRLGPRLPFRLRRRRRCLFETACPQ